ncbi:MAG: glycosyltransferase [Planctomycetota bacterium]
MPSIWYETFGLVAEAAALGLPVVASRIGALEENVVDGVTGLLVPPGRPEPLARAIERLWNDTRTSRAMGAAGRARVRDTFRDDLHFEGIRAIYERVLAEPRSARQSPTPAEKRSGTSSMSSRPQ